jgi:hypothetical protein
MSIARRSAIRRIRTLLLRAAYSLALADVAAAQQPTPHGAEFQINTYTTFSQDSPSAAMASDGSFVVVWRSHFHHLPSTHDDDIQGQRHASDGSPLGGEFKVNSYTTARQYQPSVTAAPDGAFIVIWSSRSSDTDPVDASIQGQRFGPDGSTRGAQFQVNTYTTNGQSRPSVAAAADGDFVVVWESGGSPGTDSENTFSVQGRRYGSDGSPQGDQFQVNSYTTQFQYRPAVASAANGDFVVVWMSYHRSGNQYGSTVQGQRYASDGSAQGAEFRVSTFDAPGAKFPAATATDDGGFVVAWASWGPYQDDAGGYDIRGRRYASDGSPRGAEFLINAYTTNNQGPASVAAGGGGSFLVVWGSNGSSGTDTSYASVQGRRFASDGSPMGSQFQVNTLTQFSQGDPAVAAAGEDFVVAWYGDLGIDQIDNSGAVLGQRYGAPQPVPVIALSPTGQLALGALLMLAGTGAALRRRS